MVSVVELREVSTSSPVRGNVDDLGLAAHLQGDGEFHKPPTVTATPRVFDCPESSRRDSHRVGARGQQLRAVAALSIAGGNALNAFGDIAHNHSWRW